MDVEEFFLTHIMDALRDLLTELGGTELWRRFDDNIKSLPGFDDGRTIIHDFRENGAGVNRGFLTATARRSLHLLAVAALTPDIIPDSTILSNVVAVLTGLHDLLQLSSQPRPSAEVIAEVEALAPLSRGSRRCSG